jgi:hypothetical protein
MRTAKKPGKDEKEAAKILRKYFKTDEELVSLLFTYMGSMSIMLDFLSETYGDEERIKELPERTKYAMAMAISHYKTLGMMIREEIPPEVMGMRWMSIREDAWTSKSEISQRMLAVVKLLYTQLKEEGKL